MVVTTFCNVVILQYTNVTGLFGARRAPLAYAPAPASAVFCRLAIASHRFVAGPGAGPARLLGWS